MGVIPISRDFTVSVRQMLPSTQIDFSCSVAGGNGDDAPLKVNVEKGVANESRLVKALLLFITSPNQFQKGML
jgi:hypothetical protein